MKKTTKDQLIAEIDALQKRVRELESVASSDAADENACYKATWHHNPIGLVTTDKKGLIISANPAFFNIFGYKKKTIIQTTYIQHLQVFSSEPFVSYFVGLINKKQKFDFKSPLIKTNDGRELYLRCRGLFVDKDSENSNTYIFLFGDITDFMKSELALSKSEQRYKALSERFRLITDSTQDLLWVKDLKGVYTFANQALCQVLLKAKNPQEVIGKTDMYFADRERAAHPENPQWFTFGEICINSDAVILKTKEAGRFEEYGKVRGELLILDVFKAPLRNEKGEMIGVLGNARIVTEDKLKEKEIRKLSKIIETTSQAVLIVNLENEVVYVNDSLVKMLFYDDASELLGMPMFDFADEASAKKLQEEGIPALLTSGSWQARLNVKRKDGSFFPSKERCSLITDENGNPEYFVAIFDDDTQQVNAEKALLAEKERAQLYLDIAGVLIVAINSEGNVTRINHKGCEILGYSEDEIIGKNWFDMFIPESVRRQVKEVSAKINSDEIEPVEYFENPILTKSGDERLIAWHNTVLRDESGKIIGHLSSGEDITERKEAEESLKESEKRYRMLFDLLPYGGDVFSRKGIIETVSRSSERLFGYSNSELIGKHISFLLDPEFLQIFEEKFPVLLSGKPSSAEVVMLRKDGKRLNILRAAQPIMDESGNVQSILALNVDITARKKAEVAKKRLEEQIQQTQKLESLGVLAGGIAHDFNNILTGVLGNAGLAQLSLSPVSPALDNIKKIETSAQRAAELCNQLLAYSGKGKFVVQPVNLNHIVEEMTHLLEISISKKAVLKYNLAENLPAVDADITQMRQIIMNLIINASDAIEEKSGIITITTGAMECDTKYLTKTFLDDELTEGVYIYLEVSDTGHGMDDQTRKKIFDPFFTTKFTGRGLGLAAVLGIMRGHKGAIKVYSEPGKGTTFKILMPSSKESAAKILKNVPGSGDWRGKGTVLVADDEETIRAVGRQTLERTGFKVITAEDGRDALKKFKKYSDKIVLVLLDMTMPHLSGEEVFREMRRIRPSVKVILSSGYNEQDATNGFVGKGLAGFLQKPYQPQKLIDAVRSVIEKKN